MSHHRLETYPSYCLAAAEVEKSRKLDNYCYSLQKAAGKNNSGSGTLRETIYAGLKGPTHSIRLKFRFPIAFWRMFIQIIFSEE